MESLRKVVLDIPVLSCSRISPAFLQRWVASPKKVPGEMVGAGCWWNLMMRPSNVLRCQKLSEISIKRKIENLREVVFGHCCCPASASAQLCYKGVERWWDLTP